MPLTVVTEITLVVAPGMTMATKVLPLFEMGMALTPPTVMAVAELKFVPVIVTKLPTEPFEGVKEVIVGA